MSSLSFVSVNYTAPALQVANFDTLPKNGQAVRKKTSTVADSSLKAPGKFQGKRRKLKAAEMTDFVMNGLNSAPYQFYANLAMFGLIELTTEGLFGLEVCSCPKVTGTMRVFLEDAATELLETVHPKDRPLTIVSVGAGGCYQELVYLAKLARAGYSAIRFVLIDPTDIPVWSLKDVCRDFFSQYRISAQHYRSLEHYCKMASNPANQLQPDLLLLLDLTDKKYKVNDKLLTDYSFELMNENKVVKKNAVIVYSELLGVENSKAIGVGNCCLYDGISQELIQIPHRRERLIKSDLVFPSFMQ